MITCCGPYYNINPEKYAKSHCCHAKTFRIIFGAGIDVLPLALTLIAYFGLFGNISSTLRIRLLEGGVSASGSLLIVDLYLVNKERKMHKASFLEKRQEMPRTPLPMQSVVEGVTLSSFYAYDSKKNLLPCYFIKQSNLLFFCDAQGEFLEVEGSYLVFKEGTIMFMRVPKKRFVNSPLKASLPNNQWEFSIKNKKYYIKNQAGTQELGPYASKILEGTLYLLDSDSTGLLEIDGNNFKIVDGGVELASASSLMKGLNDNYPWQLRFEEDKYTIYQLNDEGKWQKIMLERWVRRRGSNASA